jgi:major vault protein
MQERRERELVLAPNEFAYIQDTTKGHINCYVGPNKTSLAQTDQPVLFNPKSKRFQDVELGQAVQVFATAPASWYVVLKNPAKDNHHPRPGVASTLIDLEVGRKLNVPGPVSFPLWPGQMAKVIEGHALRPNEHLLIRIYDAEAAGRDPKAVLARDEVAEGQRFSAGEQRTIRGTDCRFYIPPTGVEVVPDAQGRYVREAVTLGRLEYCVLLGEDGRKRVVRGEAVVFPEPRERFLLREGSPKLPALQLRETTGLHLRVVAPFVGEDGAEHKEGEELFIHGARLIWFPREEVEIIRAGDQDLHEAITIPRGEGRYVLDRVTGEVELVRGPAMYLPDPRRQALMHRPLTEREARLLSPHEPLSRRPKLSGEAPRVEVASGYAVEVVDKGGARRVELGPTSILLRFDETLQALRLSTGRPKSDAELLETGALQVTGNKVSDVVEGMTQDLVRARVTLTYRVSFEGRDPSRWFAVENYIKLLCDHASSVIKARIRQLPIRTLQSELAPVIRDAVLGEKPEEGPRPGRLFEENGMRVYDVEVLELEIEDEDVRELLTLAQTEAIQRAIELASQESEVARQHQLEEIQRGVQREKHQTELLRMELEAERARLGLEREAFEAERRRAAMTLEGELHEGKLRQRAKEASFTLETRRAEQSLALEDLRARVDGATRAAEAWSPNLVQALHRLGDQQLLTALSENFGELAAVEGRGLLETARKVLDFLPSSAAPTLGLRPPPE